MAQNSQDKEELEPNHSILLELGKYTSSFESARQKLRSGQVDAAISELLTLIKQGDAHAHTLMGAIYEKGRGSIGKDQAKAAYHYASAIDQVGSVEAWLGLARISMYGDVDMRDYATAERCYRVLVEDANTPVAWLGLGRLYRDGCGVEQDLKISEDHIRKAAELGSIPAHVDLIKILMKRGKAASALYWRGKLFQKGIAAIFRRPPSELLREY